MAPDQTTIQAGASLAQKTGPARFRIIPQIETVPWIVTFAQTCLGKITILAAFSCEILVFVRDPRSWSVLIATIALTACFPNRRHIFIAIAPILLVVLQHLNDPMLLSMHFFVIASGILLYYGARRRPKSSFGQRPIAFLLIGFVALILLACTASDYSPASAILWNLVAIFASYLWFIGYALMDRNSEPGRDLSVEIATFRPVWGSTYTPFPKGAAYLRRIEARNPEQLAVVQLKGLKLLVWAILLGLLQVYWNKFFHGWLQIPTASEALTLSARGTPVAWHLRCESQILYFFESILTVSIGGHWIIASCRMAGFNALRNTYRPFASKTIVDFFNRYYYYFKELVVDFFYYPAFLRYWKGYPRFRMAFATVAAAFWGNLFFHFTRDWGIIKAVGLWKALENFQVFLFYCSVLTAGLILSQLRKRRARPTGFVRGQLLPTLGVAIFYCLLSVFVTEDRTYSLDTHLKYLFSLFFIHF